MERKLISCGQLNYTTISASWCFIAAFDNRLTNFLLSLMVGLCLHSQQVDNKLYSDHNRVLRSTHNNLSQHPTTCCESHFYFHNMSWLLTTCCGRPEHPSQQVHNLLWRSAAVVAQLDVDLSILLWTSCEGLFWLTWAPCCGGWGGPTGQPINQSIRANYSFIAVFNNIFLDCETLLNILNSSVSLRLEDNRKDPGWLFLEIGRV